VESSINSFRTLRFISRLFIVSALAAAPVLAQPYETVNKNFNRITSRVMIRAIAVPTLAALDYSAYSANPVRFDPQKVTPKKPAKKIGLSDLSFGGALLNQCPDPSQTPLTPQEIAQPMAWDPLQNKLWELAKTDVFARIGTQISGEKWTDPSIFIPYQEIAALYLHGSGENAQLWAKIEFKPWVKFLDPSIPDRDQDGFREIYGQLNLDAVDTALERTVFEWMANDYCTTVLNREQVVDWANILASYWYPKLNTDVVDITGQPRWPTAETEKDIVKELKGLTVADPLVVIRGNPYGKKIYNLFVVKFAEPTQQQAVSTALPTVTATPAALDSAISRNFTENNARFNAEVKAFGLYPTWAQKEISIRDAIGSFVKNLPTSQKGFVGKDDWLFFTGEIAYLNGGDLSQQAVDKNPLPHLLELQKMLKAHNISLIFVPVPNKSDVYFEKLPTANAPKAPATILNPWGRKFLSDAQSAGIEVIDLLPALLEAKKQDGKASEALFQRHDTHWTTRGLLIASQLIAERIKQYNWYPAAAQNPVRYTLKDTTVMRQGDIVDKLSETDKTKFGPVQIAAQQVLNPDGSLYKPSHPESPILLMGDSFTGVFELVDCKAGGVGAHIAAATGIPVDIITSWGGGPLVRDKMYRARKNDLDKKRVVVYMMVARDLYDYSQRWLPMEIK
jgi:alginate O-acetyltransferase complex protein AlgJ